MTEISRPWQGRTSQGALGDAGAYTAAQWAETWRTMIGTGANFANRGVIRGVSNELIVSANSPAAQNVLVGSGAALVGGRWYYNNSSVTVSVAANASGSTRNDIIILESDYTLQTVRVDILQGTPAAGLPSLSQNLTGIYQIPLAYLTLASGFATITDSMITDYREYANIPDAVGYLATNASGSVLEIGTVVVPTGTQSFTTSNVLGTPAAGVLERRTSNGAQGRVITQGIFPVLCAANVSVGDLLGVGTTTGQATANAPFSFARVLVANTGANTYALCYINASVSLVIPACSVFHNTTQNVGAGATIACALNSESYDNAGFHSTVSNTSRVVFPVAGVYGFSSYVQTGNAAGLYAWIRLNGTTTLMIMGDDTDASNFNGGLEYRFAANDYIEVMITNTTGGSVAISAVHLVASFRSK